MVEAITAWLAKNAIAFGYLVLSVLGGIVAHIREFEKLSPEMTKAQHFMAIVRRSTMALLAGWMWFLIMLQNGWEGKPYAYAGASLVGLFAPEFFDLIWSIVKKRFNSDSDATIPPR